MAVCRREIENALAGLWKYAVALSRDHDMANDLVQDTVVKALSTDARPERPESFRPWLFRILRNTHLDHMRRRQRHKGRHATIDEIGDKGGLPDQLRVEDTVINRLTVRQALMRLSTPHRDILSLVDMAGFSYAEVAEMLEVPVGTVMSRISRARRAMLVEIGTENVHSFDTARKTRAAAR